MQYDILDTMDFLQYFCNVYRVCKYNTIYHIYVAPTDKHEH